jgi:hypothetical protein
LWLVLSFILSFVSSIFLWLLLITAGIYLAACLCCSVPIAAKEKDPRFLLAMPFIFGATHILYGAGALAAIFKPVKPQPYLSNSDRLPAEKQI